MTKKTLLTLLLFLTITTAIKANAFYWHRYKIHMDISGQEAIVEGHVFEKTSFGTLYYCLILKDGSAGKNDAVMKNLDDWEWCSKETWIDPMPNNNFDYWCCQMYKQYAYNEKRVKIEDLGRIR